MLRHASADVGAFDVMAVISCTENAIQGIHNKFGVESWQVIKVNETL